MHRLRDFIGSLPQIDQNVSRHILIVLAHLFLGARYGEEGAVDSSRVAVAALRRYKKLLLHLTLGHLQSRNVTGRDFHSVLVLWHKHAGHGLLRRVLRVVFVHIPKHRRIHLCAGFHSHLHRLGMRGFLQAGSLADRNGFFLNRLDFASL